MAEKVRVCITGATGFIGRRLCYRLIGDPAVELRLFVRNSRKISVDLSGPAEVIEGDTFDPSALDRAMKNIDTAFYLVHSMGAKKESFSELDRKSAENFRNAAINAGVKRIIYLGGLGVKENSSEHLRSRIETGEILSARPDKIQTLWFRAGIVIGAGGASFDIVRNLVEKIPVMVSPRWIKTRTQTISVDDVLEYLHRSIFLDVTGDRVVDIGTDPVTFKEMLAGAAKILGLKRAIVSIPFFTPRLSSYWLVFITPVPYRVAAALVEGLKHETLMQNDNARKLFPDIKPETFEESFRKAVEEIEQRQIISKWCDSTGDDACDISVPFDASKAVYSDTRSRQTNGIPEESVFRVITGLGGRGGWLAYDFLWMLRGIMDKAVGGYGLNRGKRSETGLRIGDSLDFWKVADLVPGKRLLLLAQMKLPGRAWLEFVIEKGRLYQNACFIPRGLFGRLYWHLMYPFHLFVFNGLISGIIKRAKKQSQALTD